MEIYIDTANTTKIEKWLNMGVIDGVTNNLSIMQYSEGSTYDGKGAGKVTYP